MAIDIIQTLEVIEVMENFISRNRPPENVRDQMDLGYKIEDQSIILFEIRPQWDKPEIKQEINFAKTTYLKAKDHWKIFWLRSDLKWHSYSPNPTAQTLKEATAIIEEDEQGCFWG